MPVTVKHAGGTTEVRVNQRQVPPIDGIAISLGTFTFEKTAVVIVSNTGVDGHVIIDTVQFVPKD